MEGGILLVTYIYVLCSLRSLADLAKSRYERLYLKVEIPLVIILWITISFAKNVFILGGYLRIHCIYFRSFLGIKLYSLIWKTSFPSFFCSYKNLVQKAHLCHIRSLCQKGPFLVVHTYSFKWDTKKCVPAIGWNKEPWPRK